MKHIILAQDGVPAFEAEAPPGLQEVAGTFLGWVEWGAIIAGVLGLMIVGIMMMVGRRNRSSTAVDGAAGIPWILGGLSLVALSGGLVSAVLS